MIARAIAFLLSLTLTADASAQQETDRPNLLLLLSDDMTYHDLGSYGNPDVLTPNLDRLADQGMRFRHAYTSSPMCAPLRMSLYTGLHPVRSGGHPNHSRVHEEVRSMPHVLRDLGYRVAIIGKRHEAPEANFPFEYLGGRHHDGGKGVDLDVSKVRTFMEESQDRPWALVVASNQPHIPWNRGLTHPYDPERLELPPYLVDTEVTREALARYYAEITYMDAQMGEVLEHLEETGQSDDTLVLYLSEQGSNFTHGKWTLYDTGVRSAAIVRWPERVAPGSVSDAIIQYVDVVPTFVEAAGGNADRLDVDGASFLPVLTGAADRHHQYAYSVQTSNGIYYGPEAFGIRSVRDDRYRLIWNVNPDNRFSNMVTRGFDWWESWVAKAEEGDPFAQWRVRWYQERPEFELYDHVHDPFELHNQADNPAYSDVFDRLKVELDEWMEQQGDEGAATERAADSRMADDRWYLD